MTNKKNEIIIFLDMDDVLTQWTAFADATSNHIKKEDLADYYHTLGEDWWEAIPAFKGARGFYDALATRAPVRFLTGIKLNPGTYSGKAKWIMNFIPEAGIEILRSFMPVSSNDKRLLAKSDRILIDDRIENIKAWKESGGIGIHHTGDYADTLSRVNQAIDTLKPYKHSNVFNTPPKDLKLRTKFPTNTKKPF